MRHYSICDSFCPGVVMWCPLRAPPLSSSQRPPRALQESKTLISDGMRHPILLVRAPWSAQSEVPVRLPCLGASQLGALAWSRIGYDVALALSQSIALKFHPITRHPPLVLTITSVPVRCTALSRSANLEVWGGSSCVQLSRGCGQASTCPSCAAYFLRGMRQCCTPFHAIAPHPTRVHSPRFEPCLGLRYGSQP
jgi:hypothetical protein